jgi:hypothetical protein
MVASCILRVTSKASLRREGHEKSNGKPELLLLSIIEFISFSTITLSTCRDAATGCPASMQK